MAKKAYIGVEGVARKIKKGYVGVEGLARKIKKAYIGVGGVARPCWSGGTLTYYGTITPFSSDRYMHSATEVGDKAIIGGGKTATGTEFNTVEAYDASLTKVDAPAMVSAKYSHPATRTKDYGLFGSGYRGLTHVDAYTSSLVRTEAPRPDVGRWNHAGTDVGGYGIFAGGQDAYGDMSDYVEAYDNSLTKTVLTPLSQARQLLGGETAGNLAIFAGGQKALGSGSYVKTVDAYDSSLTLKSAPSLTSAVPIYAKARAGKYALFLSNNTTYFTMWAYDSSLTRIDITPIVTSRHDVAATWNDDIALFGGGRRTGSYVADVWMVDSSLTQSLTTSLSQARYLAVGAKVGNSALITGGANASTLKTVDAYKVI